MVYKTWVGNVYKHHLITRQAFWLVFTTVPPGSCCPDPPWLYDCSEHRIDAQALRQVLIPYSTKRWRRKTLANQQNIALAKKTLANPQLGRSSRNLGHLMQAAGQQ